MAQGDGKIWSATYSNVPVYEYIIQVGPVVHNVMRRRSDDWINATHILKVSGADKPSRTRILEREVQKGIHEKVQGGYGKYQGTWVPLPDGRELASRNKILETLRPIFDFVPGDRSPPQAPKHTTAASNKPKQPRQPAAPRRAAKPKPVPAPRQMSEDRYDNISVQLHDEETPDNSTVASASFMDEDDNFQISQQSTGHRKRKRGADAAENLSAIELQHRWYADELLDYFVTNIAEDSMAPSKAPPIPPFIDLERPIDELGHTALHWAIAIGDLAVVRDLLERGANMHVHSSNGETPLMRAVLFTNGYEKQVMPELIRILQSTAGLTDFASSTVFHHIAATTSSKSKLLCARYYFETILNGLSQSIPEHEVTNLLNLQDVDGDTALHIAARCRARKCIRSLVGHKARADIPNNKGETADGLIQALNLSRNRRYIGASSSPFGPDSKTSVLTNSQNPPIQHHHSEAALVITDKITPLILEKSSKLALAFDSEMAEKESDLSEAQALVTKHSHKLREIRQQTILHLTHEEDELYGSQQIDQHILLTHENESLLEQSQHSSLHQSLQVEESKIPSSSSTYQPQTATTPLSSSSKESESHLLPKLPLIHQLHQAQLLRQTLVRQIIQSKSNTTTNTPIPTNPHINTPKPSTSSLQQSYIRLIASAVGINHEQVESAIPEILQELEDARLSDDAVLLQQTPTEVGAESHSQMPEMVL
ncbi:MAG: hypothetical protein M1812_006013 [Candelaria pacifica]|nr:MAG: hypothetical protein M1812_006013 [Candelaria pacifica]